MCNPMASLQSLSANRIPRTWRRCGFHWLARRPCSPRASRSQVRYRFRQPERSSVPLTFLVKTSRRQSMQLPRASPSHWEGPGTSSLARYRPAPRRRVRSAFRTCFCPACCDSRWRPMPWRMPSAKRLWLFWFSSTSLPILDTVIPRERAPSFCRKSSCCVSVPSAFPGANAQETCRSMGTLRTPLIGCQCQLSC